MKMALGLPLVHMADPIAMEVRRKIRRLGLNHYLIVKEEADIFSKCRCFSFGCYFGARG
jgi:hypothetical protein